MINYIVYKHTNLINNKSYIGITSQIPNLRWKNGEGYASNKMFYNAIQKYGWNNFTHQILDENLSFEEAQELEQYYIKYYNTYVYDTNSNGYNLTRGGEGGHTLDHDLINELWDNGENIVSIAQKIGANRNAVRHALLKNPNYSIEISRQRGYSAPRESHGGNIIHQYDLNGNYIATYPSARQAAIALGGLGSSINKACDKTYSLYGYLWRSDKNNVPVIHKTHKKKISQYTKAGEYIATYDSLTEASEITKIAKPNISKVAKGERKTAGGYIWKYTE